jgi:hypothetical protein
MITKFYATREIARTIAREEGEVFKDMGKDAPKGERWSVQFKEIKDLVENAKAVEMNVPTAEDKAIIDALTEAFAGLDAVPASMPVLKKPETVTRNTVQEMRDRKGNTVQVYSKRKILVA